MSRAAYSPTLLAQRWDISAETVRQMIKRGVLGAFMAGKQYRISASEVERYESCTKYQSNASEAASASSGTKTASADAFVLRHARERPRKPKPATSTLVN